jgi:hypothetical protein
LFELETKDISPPGVEYTSNSVKQDLLKIVPGEGLLDLPSQRSADLEEDIACRPGLVEGLDDRLPDSENREAIVQKSGIILPPFERGPVRQDKVCERSGVVQVRREADDERDLPQCL